MKKVFVAILGMAFLWSCKNEGEITPENNQVKTDKSEQYIEAIVAMGFDPNQIVEYDDHFDVEEDIAIYKNQIEIGGRLKQEYLRTVTSNPLAIKVAIDGSMSAWDSEIREAIGDWNDVEAKIHLSVSSTNPHITIYSDRDADCPSSHKNLGSSTCAKASFPSSGRPGPVVAVNLDQSVVAGSSRAQKIYLIAHELGHCIGLTHTGSNDGTKIARTPEDDANSIMNASECGSTNTISNYDRIGLSQIYKNGITCAGHTSDLDRYRSPYGYCLSQGKAPYEVVDMAITKKTDRYYAFYTTSYGSGRYLASYGSTDCLNKSNSFFYTLPTGIIPMLILGMDFRSDDKLVTWTSIGKYYIGKPEDLDYYQGATNFTVASGKSYNDVKGIGITSYNEVIVWYKDGTCSRGSYSDFDSKRSPYAYTTTSGKTPDDIVGMAISNYDHSFVWFK